MVAPTTWGYKLVHHAKTLGWPSGMPECVVQMVRSSLLVLGAFFTGHAMAGEMTFTLQEKDLRPNFDLQQWIFADGVIVQGTAARFGEFTKNHPQLIPDATVILNSPGGSPIEGMLLGDAIRDLHYRTSVGAAGQDPMNSFRVSV